MISNQRIGQSSLPRLAKHVLCSNLSHGIHAAAQPLTILLAGLSKAHTDPMNIEELRALAADSYEEVERVCTLFGYLQDLVIAESTKPQLSPTFISPLLASALETVQPLFDRDGMVLRSTVPEICPLLLINRSRTLRAISSVLLIAHTLSSGCEEVELITALSLHGVQIKITNATLSLLTVSAEARLGMAAAEATIHSQQAGFSWTWEPFQVLIDLPKAPLVH